MCVSTLAIALHLLCKCFLLYYISIDSQLLCYLLCLFNLLSLHIFLTSATNCAINVFLASATTECLRTNTLQFNHLFISIQPILVILTRMLLFYMALFVLKVIHYSYAYHLKYTYSSNYLWKYPTAYTDLYNSYSCFFPSIGMWLRHDG